jgi:plastocyanin
MKRFVMILTVALAACEGEPPKVPLGSPPAPAPEATTATPPPAPESSAPPTSPAPPPATGPCCACNCAGGDAGEAAAAPTDAAAPAPPVVAARGNVTGTVTTMPAAAAANAVVYLEDAPVEPTAKMSATVDNKQMSFSPFVAVVPVGGRIVFHNSDPFPHNVFSPDHEKFNVGSIAQNGGATARTFKDPGAYTLLCNLHPGMIGYVVVSPSSYFAKADSKGRYTIKDVPAGTYKVTAWAPRQQPVTQPSNVAGDVTLDFQLHR